MKERYQVKLDVKFLTDLCWGLKRDSLAAEHKRKSMKITFIHEYLLSIFQFNLA